MKPIQFGFALHPLGYGDLQKLRVVRDWEPILTAPLVEELIGNLPPFRYGGLQGIELPDGRRAEGQFYAIPKTTRKMLAAKPWDVYSKLWIIAQQAAANGCSVLGLGAFTSIVGDGGLTVSRWSPIPVTTGNGMTVAATLDTVRQACERCRLQLSEARVLVIGATGSIGEPLGRTLVTEVGELVLITSPRSYEKLLEMSSELGAIAATDLDAELQLADVIISATSASEPIIDLALLKPGAIVCDVSRPFDTFGPERPDVLNIASGELILPGEVQITRDIGLPKTGGRVYACLAETAAIAISGQHQLVTVGKRVCPIRSAKLYALAHDLGFRLAPLEGPNGEISPEQIERVAQARGRQLVTA